MTTYSPIVQQFITDIQKQGWPSKPLERTQEIVIAYPELLPEFVEAVVAEIPKGGTFLDTALTYLPLDQFPAAVEHAISEFAKNERNDAAETVIEQASTQCVDVLHPHLEEIFVLGINKRSYYAPCPWRGSGTISLPFLRSAIDDQGRKETYRARAWQALLEPRDPVCLDYAMEVAPSIKRYAEVSAYLRLVGLEQTGSGFRQLYTNPAHHLIVNANYFDRSLRPAWRQALTHPTWSLSDKDSSKHAFGGDMPIDSECLLCGEKLHHLMTVAPVPEYLEVSEMPSLTLATCLSCLGWETDWLFYHHDAVG